MTRTAALSARALCALLLFTSMVHFFAPQVFDALIPGVLPGSARVWVYGSGVAEFGCAVAIGYRPARRAGALAAAVLFVAVFPGNVQMLLDAGTGREIAISAARLPLQIPLIWWALQVRRAAGTTRGCATVSSCECSGSTQA